MSNLLSQASLVMIPSGYKEDVVYSQIPTNGNGDLSFTRASNGTRINSAGLVEVVPWNLASGSNSFGGLSAIAKTTGQQSPIDSTSGNLLTATFSGEHYSGIASFTATVGTPYTFSVFGKFVQGVNLGLRTVFNNGDADLTTIFNLNTGAIVFNPSDHTNITITNVGNGWYRCSITFTPSVVPAFPLLFRVQMAVGTNLSFTATSGNGFLAYGAQINNGALKPYFPTTDRLNVPRLTYQNGGGGCPSLLLEKQSTNLVTYSEQFDNAAWDKTGGSITANNTTSPDGTQNADLFTANGANSIHDFYQSYSGSTTNSLSVFIKKGTARYINLVTNYTSTGTDWCSVVFDLDTLTSNVDQTGAITMSSVQIQSFGNDWYRLIVNTNIASSTSLYAFIGVVDSANPTRGSRGRVAVTSNATFYIYGAQLEASSYPTSYIPTTSSSATRVADACFKTGISSLIGQSEGFIAGEVEGLTNSYGSQSTIMSVSDGTTANRVMFSFNASTGYVTPRIFKAGSTIFVNDFSITLTQKIKFAIGWGGGRAVCYVNGTQVQETTGLTFFASGTLTRFGADDGAGSNIGIGKVGEYLIGTTNLTNAQLQSLTV